MIIINCYSNIMCHDKVKDKKIEMVIIIYFKNVWFGLFKVAKNGQRIINNFISFNFKHFK